MAQGSGPIVVGVDGSPPSLKALEWAADEASAKKVDLHLVIGWHLPLMLGMPLPLPTDFDPLAPARDVLEEARRTVAADYPDLVVKTHIEEGQRLALLSARPPTSGPASSSWGHASTVRSRAY